MTKKYQPLLFIFLGFTLGLFFNLYRLHKPASPAPLAQASIIKPEDQSLPPTLPLERQLKLPILMYHHVGIAPAGADATHKGLTVSTADFEAQVRWLHEQGYQSILLNDILLYSQGKFQMPKNPVIFTFDDGYQDAFQNALPILKKYDFTGSFGIITQWPGTTVGDNTYTSWTEIKNARSQGNEIVCHTQNHFDGTDTKFNSSYILNNLLGCQKDLIDHLGKTQPILIYPYGHYNSQYLEQAHKAGFIIGITVKEGKLLNLDNLMEIPRIRIHAHEDFEIFKKLIAE